MHEIKAILSQFTKTKGALRISEISDNFRDSNIDVVSKSDIFERASGIFDEVDGNDEQLVDFVKR